ncbi:MAG: PAS domain S-box protein, partial [Glaciimonas sp.]|nr:PAS domain S-box protein [Glaciimonas sp.]
MNIENTSPDKEISVERRLQLLLDSVNDYAICMLTPEGKVNSWTSGAQRIKGYSPDEIIGTHFSCFYLAEDQAAGLPEKALRIALANKKYESDGWRVRKDGSKFWAHVVIEVIYDYQGDFVGYVKITRDITAKQNAAEAL